MQSLDMTPYVWAKIVHMRDKQDAEVGFLGITPTDNPLLVTDVAAIKQDVSSVTTEFDDTALADFVEDCADKGLQPNQCCRVWIHTHPGMDVNPSSVDLETFKRVFGKCNWAVMCIIGSDGKTFGRLSFNVGPSGYISLPVLVDYGADFPASDHAAWDKEFRENVTKKPLVPAKGKKGKSLLQLAAAATRGRVADADHDYVENADVDGDDVINLFYAGYDWQGRQMVLQDMIDIQDGTRKVSSVDEQVVQDFAVLSREDREAVIGQLSLGGDDTACADLLETGYDI